MSASIASILPARMPMSRRARSFWPGSSSSPPLMTRSNLSSGPIAARTAALIVPPAAAANAAPIPATKRRRSCKLIFASVGWVGESRAGLSLPARPVELHPRRRVVARLGKIAHPRIHAGVYQARRELLAEQQVIDAQPRVALPVLAEVIPERVDRFVRMPRADRIDPSLLQQPLVALAALGLQQRILAPGARVVDIEVRRHHVVVAREHHRMAARPQALRMLDQALEPRQLVIELRPGLRIAVRQIQAAADDPLHPRLQITPLLVLRIARQLAPAHARVRALREDRHPVPRHLPSPQRPISRIADRLDRQARVGRLQLLQADDIRRFFLQPLQQMREPRGYAVHVESRELHWD